MAEPLLLGRYHDAVTDALKKIGWVRDAGAYPERNVPRFSGLTTPAVYFSINSWEQGGGNEGQLSVNLTCDLFVVVDAAGSGVSQPEIFVRTAAADITQWIDGQQFGLGHIEPAVFTTAERECQPPDVEWRHVRTYAVGYRLQHGKPTASHRFVGLRHATMGITKLCRGYPSVRDYESECRV